MTDNEKPKPVTLADYIPPERKPVPKSKRASATKRDRERLDALDREVRDEDPKARKQTGRKSRKKKSNVWTIVFYAVVLVIVLKVID
ncbi:MAG: hypothetical protein ACSHX3_11505 [Litorimonas sp.]